MIINYHDRDTRYVFERVHVARLSMEIQRQAQRKLVMLNNATTVNDLSAPPGNRLERLSGDRSGQCSIRVNDQWRICFRWENGNASEVELVDYH